MSGTTEGMPSRCPLCGAEIEAALTGSVQDVACPSCGHLILASISLLDSIVKRFAEVLGTSPGAINAETRFVDLGVDSLDTIEMLMELEEEHGVSFPDGAEAPVQTIGDVVRFIQDQRRGQ
ncbi:MAG: phosphopantetheine-binding protein [Planctomycetota bacterium]